MSNPEKAPTKKKPDDALDAKEELTAEELEGVAGGIIAVACAPGNVGALKQIDGVPTVGIDAAVIPKGGTLA